MATDSNHTTRPADDARQHARGACIISSSASATSITTTEGQIIEITRLETEARFQVQLVVLLPLCRAWPANTEQDLNV
jgi:hypothetical protein